MDRPALENDGAVEAYRTYEIGCDATGIPPMEPAAFRRIWGGPEDAVKIPLSSELREDLRANAAPAPLSQKQPE